MAYRLGRVPVEAEMTAFDGEVRGDGQLLAGAGAEQSAVVADAQTKDARGCLGRSVTDEAQQGQFALLVAGLEIGSPGSHFLRIGQDGGQGTEGQRVDSIQVHSWLSKSQNRDLDNSAYFGAMILSVYGVLFHPLDQGRT